MKSSTEINTCMQCELYKKELKEKDTKIKLLENNILKIKSLLSESGSLIDGYNEIMEENKNLKIEIDKLKNEINLNNNNNYQFELLKQKMLRYQKENQDLKATKQFYESQKEKNLNIKDANETKIKRELSQKDKEINQLNTVIYLLKLHNNDKNLSNEEIIKKYSKSKISNHNDNNSIIEDEEMLFMENDNKLNSFNNNINEIDYKDNNNNFNINNITNNNFKMIDIINEKEYLSGEYQKYKQKYIVYKFKYHEFKKTTKLFLSYMKMIPPGSSLSSFLDNFNENKTMNLLGAKRLKSYTDKEELKNSDNINNIKAIRNIHMNNQLRKKSEETFKDIFKMPSLFNNTDDYDYNDNNDNNEKNESEEKNRNNKESSKKRRKKNEKKNLIKIKEEENDSNKSENESKEEKEKEKKKEIKKRGRKPKKLVKKTKNENDSDEEEEKSPKKKRSKKKESKESKENKENKDNENNEKEEKKMDKSETPKKDKAEEENKDNKNEKEEVKEEKEEVKDIEEKEKEKEEHIGPIPKNIKKKLDPIEQKVLNTNNLLNLLSNTPDKINEESINSILSLQNTIQEKTSFLFEIIVPNLIKLELSRVLSLFETFIEINQNSKNIIGINILENIHLNMNSNNLLNKKNHLKITNKTNDTYQNYINKNFSQSIYIISFLIDILYRKLIDVSCVSNFIYQLLFDKNIDNKNKSSILIILTNTIKEKMNIDDDISNKKLFLKEEQLNKYSSTENENKFYFFLSFKNNLVSENIVKLIIAIYDKHNKNENTNAYDTEIINIFNKLLEKIPNDKELKIEVPKFLEEYKSSIKFNTDIFYLEIFQALNIIVEIKEMKWIYENIFTNILWKCFQNSKKDSLKRALSIYYSSLLFYLCLKNGIKNHTNENLLEQQEFSRLYAWLYSIYNTQPQFESSIGFYERLCALSWIVESPIVTMSEKVLDTIKQVVNNKVKGENESLCPTDFLDKLRKLNIL